MTGSEDKSVYIYDKETTEVVKKLNGHSGVVHLAAAFDSTRIISTSIENVLFFLFFIFFLFFSFFFFANYFYYFFFVIYSIILISTLILLFISLLIN